MRKFSGTLAVAAITLLACPAVRAQPAAPEEREGWAIGYTVHRLQDDFGTGALLSSPHFAAGLLRLTLGGAVGWSPHDVNQSGEQEWAGYGAFRLVLEAGDRAPGSPVRLYAFGGPVLLVLPSHMADKPIALGGIGGFGFEYYFMHGGHDGPVTYFTEFGGIGSWARADKLPGAPMLADGFAVTAGFRWTL